MKLHRDSKAEILLLVRVPNQSVATERAFLYGDGVVQLMHTEMGQQFYHQFMSLPKPVVEGQFSIHARMRKAWMFHQMISLPRKITDRDR